jgi:hypothetical protein
MATSSIPSCALLHRSVIERAGLFDEGLRCAVDTEYFHRVSACAPLGIVTTPLFLWRRGPGDTIVSSGNMEQLVLNALLSLDRAIQLREPSARALALYETGAPTTVAPACIHTAIESRPKGGTRQRWPGVGRRGTYDLAGGSNLRCKPAPAGCVAESAAH